MAERLLTDDFELRGQPLTNKELLAIYDYGKGY